MGVLPSPIYAHRRPGGGINMDLSTRDGLHELGLIRGAREYVPQELKNNGGLHLVWAVGITGSAYTNRTAPTPARPCRRTLAI